MGWFRQASSSVKMRNWGMTISVLQVLPAACSPHGAGWQSWHSRCRHHWRQLDAKTPGECYSYPSSLVRRSNTNAAYKFQHPDFPSDLVTLLAAVEATLEVVWKEEDGKERLSNHLSIMTLLIILIHDSFKHGHRSSNHLPSDWLTISMERKLLRRILLPSLPSTTKLFTHKVEKFKDHTSTECVLFCLGGPANFWCSCLCFLCCSTPP